MFQHETTANGPFSNPPEDKDNPNRIRLTGRGKAVAWLAGLAIVGGGTAALVSGEHGQLNSALTHNKTVVEEEIGQGIVNPDNVTLYTVPKTEAAYNVASGAEGHLVDASDPVINEVLAQTGQSESNTTIPANSKVIIQKDVVAGHPLSLTEQVEQHKA